MSDKGPGTTGSSPPAPPVPAPPPEPAPPVTVAQVRDLARTDLIEAQSRLDLARVRAEEARVAAETAATNRRAAAEATPPGRWWFAVILVFGLVGAVTIAGASVVMAMAWTPTEPAIGRAGIAAVATAMSVFSLGATVGVAVLDAASARGAVAMGRPARQTKGNRVRLAALATLSIAFLVVALVSAWTPILQ